MSEDRSERPHLQPLQLLPGADYIPAPLPARTLAYILDIIASVIITFSLHRAVELIVAGPLSGGSLFARTLTLSTWFMGTLGYWVVVPLATGSTPGKMLFHLRVVPERDRPLGAEQVVLREVIGHALGIAALGIGTLVAARDPKARTLQDRVAGTRLVQFTRPRPELYQVADLRTADEEGILYTDQLPQEDTSGADTAPPDTAPPPGQEAAGEYTGETIPGQPAPEETGVPSRPSAARPMPHIGEPADRVSDPSKTIYRRPEGETAYERKQRAARGPTVEVLAEALRNTAFLVDSGQLMPKVLERKRTEFVERMRTADLGPDPKEAVRMVVTLGRNGLLGREDLERLRDILRERMDQ
ncbi:MAG: RDD family protein [bacterium]